MTARDWAKAQRAAVEAGAGKEFSKGIAEVLQESLEYGYRSGQKAMRKLVTEVVQRHQHTIELSPRAQRDAYQYAQEVCRDILMAIQDLPIE